jgi:Acetyl-coenzyme A synthetase N-terminus
MTAGGTSAYASPSTSWPGPYNRRAAHAEMWLPSPPIDQRNSARRLMIGMRRSGRTIRGCVTISYRWILRHFPADDEGPLGAGLRLLTLWRELTDPRRVRDGRAHGAFVAVVGTLLVTFVLLGSAELGANRTWPRRSGAGAASSPRPLPGVTAARTVLPVRRRSRRLSPPDRGLVMGRYQQAFLQSIGDPDAFWGGAAELISWYRKPTVILDRSSAPFYRWFPDGVLNTCYNALDRHVEAGRGEQAALVGSVALAGPDLG